MMYTERKKDTRYKSKYISSKWEEERAMTERPHSRKVKVEEGTAEVKKGERFQTEMRASQRDAKEHEELKSVPECEA